MVDATTARLKLEVLRSMGWGATAIEAATGVHRATQSRILDGQDYIQLRVHQKIWDMEPLVPVAGHHVPNTIVRRLLDEVRTWGLTLAWFYRTAGVSRNYAGNYCGGSTSWENYVKIRALYDRLAASEIT